ncbi:hypothetical protein GE061_011917 [Apolygus lucorum]|uniref:Uncharacterized protein n=1 Tax=Apolygus lucorum TaxID=248454 RepID=A0A8S9XUY0_APOLU|nr:hypothetical protein GE061_011917 [Apolygus lucorum]
MKGSKKESPPPSLREAERRNPLGAPSDVDHPFSHHPDSTQCSSAGSREMANTALLVAVVTTVFRTTSAQLFPFSSLRSYIDQHHSESVELTTKAPPPVDAYRYLQESGRPFFSSPGVGVEHKGTPIEETELERETERTVLVTPKPRYVPQRLVPEPDEDPNSPNIPSIGYGAAVVNGLFHRTKEPASSPSISSPVRSVTIEKPSELNKGHSKYEPVLLKETPYKPHKIHYVEKTVVDSVPSLSVTIPLDGYKKKSADDLIDYLTPPKFPSVYENHMKTFQPSPVSNLIVVEDDKQASSSSTVVPVKTKKKKKNKNKSKGDSSISESEKRVRVRTRTPSFKPKKGEPLELQASGTEIYVRPPYNYRPPKISTPHPIEEQIAAETNFGLGGSGGGERVEFQLHGQSGPESYKFGFDTGDGKNRHFRYEEKDHTGNVKGHYGYYDKTGKLQVVNYHADKHGFHASSP